MTKKLIESKLGNEIIFDFINLNPKEDLDFISSIIINDFKGKVLEEGIAPYNFGFKIFELNDLAFKLYYDDYVEMGLILLKTDKEKNELLRQLAEAILKIIKERNKKI